MDQPPAANQKRKRGRRANASRDNGLQDASTSAAPVVSQDNQPEVNEEAENGDMDGNSRPRKRGRRAKEVALQEQQLETPETQPGRRNRRQPSAMGIEVNPEQQASKSTPSDEVKTTRRGRPKKGDQQAKPTEPEAEEADDENENEGDSSLLRRSKRQRRSLEDSHASPRRDAVQGEETGSSATQRLVKRKKQPVRSKNKEQQQEEEADPEEETETTSQTQKKGSKRNRPLPNSQASMNEVESGLEPDLPRKKRGRRARAEGGDTISGSASENRPSQRRTEQADNESQAEAKKRRSGAPHRKMNSHKDSSERRDQSPSRSPSPASPSSPPYRHIAKRTRRVTHNVIESKWSSLEPSSLTNVASLLHSASLPTLHHVPQKQYAHAEDVLEKVIKGLRKRSARLPFPLASTLPRREDELDFEKTQSAAEVLLSQLDPLQHSVELLKREKERAEKELDREYKVLNQLSTNARAEARERRDRLRKVHVLVPESNHDLATNQIDLLHADKTTSQVFTRIHDEELLSLASQINNHMESMRGNLGQVDGVLPAIAESHALLRTTLQPQLSLKQLENIMFGQAKS
ncbi:CENP-Q, a CENPA-CAD centromere complex subunit-domain-containing protein [Xylaria bambusicola]|uniref:CENP-Q, a CENPA-CAD centromere complex subunit-domain-containing protein n=1 Tax=Xylaria bambusicola TaxID=326684 RepID=UPI002008C2E5|nr:CENP-Q, a CENPA-CAD centromere complex subunit-domain-containing protein [Xylaria bambusicola]KAI0518174.1 CENP-Q, a CENPA-CAD centromere complex subunit-domain-containing protein [Xylaria bambusicola]